MNYVGSMPMRDNASALELVFPVSMILQIHSTEGINSIWLVVSLNLSVDSAKREVSDLSGP